MARKKKIPTKAEMLASFSETVDSVGITEGTMPLHRIYRIGRPPKYETLELLQERIHTYFDFVESRPGHLSSKAEFALWLGVTKEWLSDHTRDGDPFSDAIRNAYSQIEVQWVQTLGRAYPAGSIFYLKNAFKHDYRDSYDHTQNMNTNVTFTLPPEVAEKYRLVEATPTEFVPQVIAQDAAPPEPGTHSEG